MAKENNNILVLINDNLKKTTTIIGTIYAHQLYDNLKMCGEDQWKKKSGMDRDCSLRLESERERKRGR